MVECAGLGAVKEGKVGIEDDAMAAEAVLSVEDNLGFAALDADIAQLSAKAIARLDLFILADA